jgi:hypothetical protein
VVQQEFEILDPLFGVKCERHIYHFLFVSVYAISTNIRHKSRRFLSAVWCPWVADSMLFLLGMLSKMFHFSSYTFCIQDVYLSQIQNLKIQTIAKLLSNSIIWIVFSVSDFFRSDFHLVRRIISLSWVNITIHL